MLRQSARAMRLLQQRSHFSSFNCLVRTSARCFVTMATSRKRCKLSDKASLFLEKGDLTKAEVDAIVNAANAGLLGGGGVDGAIHRAAGRGLSEACREFPEVESGVRCPTGEARITRGFDLSAEYVIHTVGPIYSNDKESRPLLYNAYKNSLALANDNQLKTLAFPAISCGVYGYPVPDAARISIEACKKHVGNVKEITFVLFGDKTYEAYVDAAEELLEAE